MTRLRNCSVLLIFLILNLYPALGRAQSTPAMEEQPAALESVEEHRWETELFERARSSIVRIDVGDGMGTGFVFHTRRHVATAFHVIGDARRVYVSSHGGARQRATVVAVDSDHDLAILVVPNDLEGEVLVTAPTSETPSVGDHVVAIGHPFGIDADNSENLEGLLNWSLTSGVVSAVGAERIQTDAAVNPGNSGGPLLDRNGHVIGVLVRREGDGIGLAIRTHRLNELGAQIEEQGIYRGRWRFYFDFGMTTQFDRTGSWMGAYLTVGTLAYDRIGLIARFGGLSLIDDTSEEPLNSRIGSRVTMELETSYRFAIPLGRALELGVILGVGAALTWQSIETSTLRFEMPSSGCDAGRSACNIDVFEDRSESESWFIRPTFSLGLTLARVLVTYSFHLDVADPAASTHQILLGIEF